MVDLEALALRARGVSARSRARMACRVALVIAPLACVSLLGGAHAASCACFGIILFAASAFLRWRNRIGVRSVATGFVMGAIPMFAALALNACGIKCSQMWQFSDGETACFVAGAIAGVGATLLVARSSRHRRQQWIGTIFIASLTSALGCLGLGTMGIISTLVALVASATVVWIPVSLRAS